MSTGSSSHTSSSSSTDNDDTPVLQPSQPPLPPSQDAAAAATFTAPVPGQPPLPPRHSPLKRRRSGERVQYKTFAAGDTYIGNGQLDSNINNDSTCGGSIHHGHQNQMQHDSSVNQTKSGKGGRAQVLESKTPLNMPKVQYQQAGNIKFNKDGEEMRQNVKFYVRNGEAGKIIGKAGDQMRQIETLNGVKMHIQGRQYLECKGYEIQRMVTIHGKEPLNKNCC